jgi:hypothetical protein
LLLSFPGKKWRRSETGLPFAPRRRRRESKVSPLPLLEIHVKEFLIISNPCLPEKECTFYKKGVVPMVIKFQCPECGKRDNSELVEVLPERKYRMKCGDCECTYILTTSADDERKDEKPSKGCSC